MRCVVTAGPTYEKLDEVRRLTNFSTGRLGIELAGWLTAQGHDVLLLVGEQATWRGERRAVEVQEFSTTNDLLEKLRRAGGSTVGAVFHVAAVSDFAFGRTFQQVADGQLQELRQGKLSTRQGTLLAELLPTPKVISHLREFFPNAQLVGWKYEVDGDRDTALVKGREQMLENRSSACVVNGPAYGEGFCLLEAGGAYRRLANREELFEALGRLMTAAQVMSRD